MSGFLETYGAGEEKRLRRIKRAVLAGVVLLAAGLALYFTFRNYREVRQAKLFFELLERKDYQAAYALWGCTPESPCRDYTMEKFLEDWGPGSAHSNVASRKIVKTRGCAGGVILEIQFGSSEPDYLWVDRENRNLGFAPWPVCNPVLPRQGQ